jgi:hypothetical protein
MRFAHFFLIALISIGVAVRVEAEGQSVERKLPSAAEKQQTVADWKFVRERLGVPPLIRDEKSAIRVVRALLMAQRPRTPMAGEDRWFALCQARLSKDEWVVSSRGAPHTTTQCLGAMIVEISAKDGRWLGADWF